MAEIPYLVKMLQDENHQNRYDACEELRLSKLPLPQEAIDALIIATKDTDPDVADAAKRALALHTSNTNIPNTINPIPKSEKESPMEKTYGIISLVNSFILFVVGLGSLCFGLFGLGTGDDGGRTEAMPFVIIYPVILLFIFFLPRELRKTGKTKPALLIEILSIICIIFLVATNIN